MNQKQLTYAFFAVLCFFVPCVFFMFIVLDIAPVWWLVIHAFKYNNSFGLLYIPFIVVQAFIYFWLSKSLAFWVFKGVEKQLRAMLVFGVIVLLCMIAWSLPIYGSAGFMFTPEFHSMWHEFGFLP